VNCLGKHNNSLYSYISSYDTLKTSQKKQFAFTDFVEGNLHFPPNLNYNIYNNSGSNNTSNKNKIITEENFFNDSDDDEEAAKVWQNPNNPNNLNNPNAYIAKIGLLERVIIVYEGYLMWVI